MKENRICKNEWKKKHNIQKWMKEQENVTSWKKNIQIEWKKLKTRKNKKTIIKYTKTVKNWVIKHK